MTETSSPSPPHLERPASQLMSAWWNLTQVMKHRIAPMLEREHGVGFKDFVALNAIDGGANYPRLMCERLSVPPSGVSRMLEDLTRHELVIRSLDPEDSRRVKLEITPKGHAVLEAARETMLSLLDSGLSELPEEQVRLFAGTLRQLSDLMARAAERQEK